MFDAVVAQFEADPDMLLKPGRLRAPVGMGVEIVLLTPYVLDAVRFLITELANKLGDKAFDSLAQSIQDRLASSLAARRWRRGEDTDEPTGKSAVGSSVEREAAPTAVPMNEVTMTLTVHLSVSGANPVATQGVAESVIKTLMSGGSGC